VATFISTSAAETEKLGRDFAGRVAGGTIIGLVGELGAGKTQFAKGLVRGVGSPAEVTSPTFTLIHEYGGGRFPVYHLDFFRIENRRSAERLGLDDYFSGDGIVLIEWADKFEELMPSTAQWIRFETKSEDERIITTP
jgi:tRNA threonylcarbamoyladenosine biosynthesis protein TsaE